MENEDMEGQAGAGADATAEANSGEPEILAGEGEAALGASPDVETDEKTNLPDEQSDKQPEINLDDEVVLEVAGKTFTMKQGDIVNVLENAQKMTEREQAIAEKEKSLNRDYTQKSQQNAEFRKSVESVFGRFPEKQELQALGRIWKSYFEDPQAAELIDGILRGEIVSDGANKTKSNPDAYARNLERKIQALESQLHEFRGTIEEREQAKSRGESKQIWDSWVAKKAEAGIKITEELDQLIGGFIAGVQGQHPDWEPHRILDEAYRHATIDQLKTDTAKGVLKSVDAAKKKGIIKITPKAAVKPDKELSYAEILKTA